MAEMPSYQIEMLWTCGTCGRRDNRGLARHCQGCGKPKGVGDAERFPDDISEANALVDPSKLAQAKAGPDWQCKYCDSLQSSLGPCCTNCGCERTTGAKPYLARELVAIQQAPPARPYPSRRVPFVAPELSNVPSVHAPGPARGTSPAPVPFDENDPAMFGGAGVAVSPTRVERPAPRVDGPSARTARVERPALRFDGPRGFVPLGAAEPAALPSLPPTPGSSEEELTRAARWRNALLARRGRILEGLVAVAVALVLWMVLRTEKVNATVAAVSWEHRVLIDRYQVWRREGWTPASGAFEVHDEGQRVHHQEKVLDHYEDVTRERQEACGEDCSDTAPTCRTTPRVCRSNANGTADCSGGDEVCSGGGRKCTTRYCTRTESERVARYRDEPVYASWYSWKVWDWGYHRTVTHRGATLTTTWPSEAELAPPAPLGEREQERNHQEASYHVTLQDDRGTRYELTPQTLEEFLGFPLGAGCKLRVGFASGFELLERPTR
jgi:hypothetical protein